MATQYLCENRRRLQVVRDESTLNAIDYLEVLDADAPAGSPPQQTLLVRCLRPVTALDASNVRIEGGVRRTPVIVEWAFAATAIPGALITTAEQTYFTGLPQADRVLVVRTKSLGDFSTYTLRLVASPTDASPPPNFDSQLSAVDFSFKVECPSEFDCRADDVCPPPQLDEPALDYLAKDYASFRRLLLDRLSVLMPDWRERNPADQMVTLVELLAYVGDRLSYFQDAVATEAYLGTARRRTSVRRHARLLDYRMHDGSNARAWVRLEVQPASLADGLLVPAGQPLLAGYDAPTGGIDLTADKLAKAVQSGAEPYETLHDVRLDSDHNELRFYTWGDSECCLPRGATRATLRGEHPNLKVGELLVFEEVKSPTTGAAGDADPSHRQAVRLTRVAAVQDPVGGQFEDPPTSAAVALTEIEWSADDALTFPLCISARAGEELGEQLLEDVSVARGNVVLVDHGLSVEETLTVPLEGVFRPTLAEGPVTQQGRVQRGGDFVLFDPDGPARSSMNWSNARALPAIRLVEDSDIDRTWLPQKDLLGSGRFAREFVVEVGEDGRAMLRFGDGIHGRRPTPGSSLQARYRVGSGRSGNVGAGAIRHLVLTAAGVSEVRNVLPARGGADPESMQQVREYAPQAFRVQERAVTKADYAEVTERRHDVQKAVAAFRWTGSWHTAFVTADRIGGDPAQPAFREDVRAYLERFRMAGVDLQTRRPRFVPLDVAIEVCVKTDYFAAEVKRRLLEVFSRHDLGEGRRGFFHPDNFTFGQPVYLSQLYETAMDVDGVAFAEVTTFQRWGATPNQELDTGVLKVGADEIVRLDNDPNFPENGKLELVMEGGL